MKQYEIWLVNLDPAVGSEIKKVRPCVIVSNDGYGKLPSKIIAPITTWKDHYSIVPWMIKIDPDKKNGLGNVSAIDCYQLRCADKRRFIKKIGEIPSMSSASIQKVVRDILS